MLSAILLFSLYLFTTSCNAASPDQIAYNHLNDYPESIGYSPSLGCFITGAGRNPPYTLLKIYDNGTVVQFAPSVRLSAGNLLVQGIKVDEPNKRIYYVATSTQQTLLPIPVKNESFFAIANFNGTIERIVDLTPLADPGTSVTANDLVLDENKNVYITDNSGRLLKVDKNGVASVVLGLTGFPSVLSSGIAGIVYLQANRSLVIANELLNEFYRVDIASRASSKVIVRTTVVPNVQPNGMVLGQDGNIYVTSALVSVPAVVFSLKSTTNFTTASVANYGTEVVGAPKAGTGLVFRENKLFICHALLPATTPLASSGTVDKIKLLN